MTNYSWHKAGTVTVQHGSTVVTGLNTGWLIAGIKNGDIFVIDDTPFEIAEVTGSESLALVKQYPGENATNKEYAIIQRAGEVLQADLALLIQNAVKTWNTRETEIEQRFTELEQRTKALKGLGLYRDADGDLSQDENAIEPVNPEDYTATTSQVQQMIDETFDEALSH